MARLAPTSGNAAGAGGRIPLLLNRRSTPPEGLKAALDRPALFFGGKGGVGKTTLAAATALRAAAQRRRTLLVSTDPAHSISDALRAELGPVPTQVQPELWAVEIDPAGEADRYIEEVKHRIADTVPPRLSAEVERHFDIARMTPGAEEAALFDRFTRFMDMVGSEYDRIVFDTAPLGYTLRLLSLPEHLQLWISGLIDRRRKVNVLQRMWENVSFGTRRPDPPRQEDPVLAALEERKQRFERARRALMDPKLTGFVFVVVPEWLAVAETERGLAALERHAIPVAAVITNRVVNDDAGGVFAPGRREKETTVLADIDRRFARYTQARVSELDGDLRGVAALDCVARALWAE